MLIITRRTGEITDITLEDGRRLEIALLGVQGNQIRLGIAAPKSIGIDRREVTLRKAKEDADSNAARGEQGERNGNVDDDRQPVASGNLLHLPRKALR